MDNNTFEQKEQTGRKMSVEAVMREIEKENVFMEESGGGVTFSGGEPLMQPEFLIALLKACKSAGIHTVVDTSGQVQWETLEEVAHYTDLFLYDYKHTDNDKHKIYTGAGNRRIAENLKKLLATGATVRGRIPVVPGFNFSDEEMQRIADELKGMNGRIEQVDLLPYHAIATHKYNRFGIKNKMEGVAGLQKSDLSGVKKVFEKAGFKVKIGG